MQSPHKDTFFHFLVQYSSNKIYGSYLQDCITQFVGNHQLQILHSAFGSINLYKLKEDDLSKFILELLANKYDSFKLSQAWNKMRTCFMSLNGLNELN